MPNNKIKVLMASAELAPFAKVGGLADVVGSLPKALDRKQLDVRLVIPLYGSIDKSKYKLKQIYKDLEVPSGYKLIKINIWQAKLPETDILVYFIDCPKYFKDKAVYISGDNAERYLFFSQALLYAIPIIKFKPDVIHCHDSHVALIPDLLRVTNLQFLKDIKTLYTIHNFRYQGRTEPNILSTGNLSEEKLKSLSVDARDGDINFTVQGILQADLINTVSPTYAREIMTEDFGESLDNIIKKRKNDVSGVLNGIDVEEFDPRTDKLISVNYSAKTLSRKINNKLALQEMVGLPQDRDIAVVGLVSRLVWQKGIDLITELMGNLPCQFIFLGTGTRIYEAHLRALEKTFKRKVRAKIMFDIKLAQQIYAGADIFLMPSRFEPCGLGQMIAMRYGTVPVVRATGGLKDTVDSSVGFSFNKANSQSLSRCLKQALDVYYNVPDKWLKLKKNCLKQDFSWQKSAREYIQLYKKLLRSKL